MAWTAVVVGAAFVVVAVAVAVDHQKTLVYYSRTALEYYQVGFQVEGHCQAVYFVVNS